MNVQVENDLPGHWAKLNPTLLQDPSLEKELTH